jgi:hypothetical protein
MAQCITTFPELDSILSTDLDSIASPAAGQCNTRNLDSLVSLKLDRKGFRNLEEILKTLWVQ